MADKFTVDGFRSKLLEWAIMNEVKQVRSDVYHMLLLREEDVTAFMKLKGYDTKMMADAIEAELDVRVINSGNSWAGNKYDVEGGLPSAVKEYKQILELRKKAEEDPMLSEKPKEEDEFYKQMNLAAEITKLIRFAEDQEQAIIQADLLAKHQGKEGANALDIFKQMHISCIGYAPKVYETLGLKSLLGKDKMRQDDFWVEANSFSETSDKFQESFSKNNQGITRLMTFLQQNPDSAQALKTMLSQVVKEELNQRFGPPSPPDQKEKFQP